MSQSHLSFGACTLFNRVQDLLILPTDIMVTSMNPPSDELEDIIMSLDKDNSIGDDVGDFVSDAIRRDGNNDPPDGNWTFQAQSARGAKVSDGLSKRVSAEQFSLVHNPVDNHLLEKMRKEVKHLLCCGRIKLHGIDENQRVTAFDVFTCALPPSILLLLKEWMMTADDKETAAAISFEDIIGFLRGELNMRLYQTSAG